MPVRIAGVNLPENKRIIIALSYIKGIGKFRAAKILKEVGIEESVRAKEITDTQASKILAAIDANKYEIEGSLTRLVQGNIKRLKEIGSYRGYRHIRNLPARGQRTKTNSRTVRGNVRKTMMSGRKPTAQKT